MKKNTLLLLILLLIGVSKTFSQEKIKFTKQNFWINSISFPENAILDDVLTQALYVKFDGEISVAEKNIKRDFFQLDGYLKDNENGKVKIYLTIQEPKYLRNNIDSVYNRQNNTYTFSPMVSFKITINVEVKYQGNSLYKEDISTLEKILYYTYGTKKDVQTQLANAAIKNEFGAESEKAINIALYKIQAKLNRTIGFSIKSDKETFVWMTNKEHPEYTSLLAFETEISSQLKQMTLEKGLDKTRLNTHLNYLEGLLVKYTQSPENEKLRFIVTNNLAETYFLLEEKERSLFFADLLVKNDFRKSWGYELIARLNQNAFVVNKIRAHTSRFSELSKLGFKIQEDMKQEKEDARLAFFEKIERDEADWEQEKNNRSAQLANMQMKWNNLLDSAAFQQNAPILSKLVEGFGGSQILKGVEKVHLTSTLRFEDSNVPTSEDKWCGAFANFLLKKKMPDNYFFVINGIEAWKHDDRVSGEKWKKIPNGDYWDSMEKLVPLYVMTSFRLDLWNNFELQEDVFSNGKLCYHLSYIEKTVNAANRSIPKKEHHLYIDKGNFTIISSETVLYEDGKKISMERKIYDDYRELISLNSGKIPHRIQYQIEDYYGDTFFEERIDKVDINMGFANRIFIKEIYLGGFK